MSDENQNDNNQEPTENKSQETGDEQQQERHVPVSALQKQAADFKAQIDAQAAELAKFKAAQEDAERKKLEEQGEWQKLAEQAKAEAEQAKAEAASQIRKLTLRAELANARDEVTLKGLMADCPPDVEPADYAKELREKHPEYFQAPTLPAAAQPGQGSKSAGGSSDDGWAAVNKDFNSGIPARVSSANLKILQYQRENSGKLPPGNWQ